MTPRPNRRDVLGLGVAAKAWPSLSALASRDDRKTRRVVLVTLDGLRPEEVFTGAEEALLTKQAGVADPEGLRRRFWRDSPEARREALLPFLWGTISQQGQVFGNAAKGSVARVTNGRNFSYPGYNEILTGRPDDRIDSNAKRPNPNVTVLEWLAGRPGFAGSIAAYTCWDVFPSIINRERSGLTVVGGWEPIPGDDLSDRQRLLNALNAELPRHWEGVCYDALAFEAAMEHLRLRRPKLLYVAFGETDDYAHEGRYDFYLDAAHRADAMIAKLWEALQRDPEYRGNTTILITTDHGRGPAPDGWKGHGADVPGADRIWVAAIGPDTPGLGERSDVPDVTQSQVASTVAGLLGEDFRSAFPEAAPPIADLL